MDILKRWGCCKDLSSELPLVCGGHRALVAPPRRFNLLFSGGTNLWG